MSPERRDNAPPQEKHTVTRLAVAAAAWEVGSKIGWIGTAIDAGRLLKGTENLSLKARGKAVLDAMKHVAAQEKHWYVGWPKAVFKVGKFSVLLGIGGGLAFGVLGWIRAEKLGGAGDILRHPVHSMKILVGLENPPASPLPSAEPMPLMETNDQSPKRFTDSIKSRGQNYQQALADEPATAAPPLAR